ncbi:MAG: CDP-alcohol phosphatidyltransferase [Chitinophagaceae bacterium]|jgi:CDP-diacylglycerol--serine O-phosphatidyltransferase|nr:CDP-alcohol phosphatidyltransferase [Chitinophagaceae bacterium]
MKQIPNLFTLLNLLFGCLAIICILQPGLTLTIDGYGENLVDLPERIYLASAFLALAAVIDFCDGFFARLLKVPSDMGKQLDSLADVVSFGVAPGMIVYQFLRLSLAKEVDGLDQSVLWLVPALILPCAGAYRLARFNIDTQQSYGFKGVPIPAAGLFFAAFPLIYWQTNQAWVLQLLLNKWFWYALVIAVSYLMVSTLPMLALKFQSFTLQKALPFIILLVLAAVTAFLLGWLAVPVTFIAYVVLSLLFKQQVS